MRGVLVMLLAASPVLTQQPAKWRLVEEWRVGGEVDGPHSFGDVRGMGLLPDGRIVLLDYKDQQVHFLDATGKPVRTVGRKGAGPGEYQQANGLVVAPSGNIIINDPSNNRLTVLASSGDLVRTIPIPNPWGFGYLWDAYFNSRGLLDEYVMVRKAGDQEPPYARRVWSADFSKIDTIIAPVCANVPRPEPGSFTYEYRGRSGGTVMGIPFVQPRAATVRSSDGATWAGRYPTYGTIERTPAGKCEPDVTIQLRGPRVRIPGTMRDSAIDEVKRRLARYNAPDPDFSKVPREFPSFEALFLDASKRLWVERRIDTNARRFEVFSPAGTLMADVESPAVFRGYRPLIIGNYRILGFIADQDDVLYLASFRIVRG